MDRLETLKKQYPPRFLQALPELEVKLGYRFTDPSLLAIALTHSSYSHEHKAKGGMPYNERLEFLGDSVLGLSVSRFLFADKNKYPEGMLTKLRAMTVCADALYDYALQIDLGRYMLLNRGLEEDGGRKQKNVLADCFEALLAAIYLDGGQKQAEEFALRFCEPRLVCLTEGGVLHDKDYKSLLQEKVQTSPGEKPEYFLVGEAGPDHKKTFSVEVRIHSNVVGKGSGRSKREAEQNAARVALTWFGENE